MTINWWTLGLQAVNVLILVWLLSRVFWRPVAAAIAARQDAAQTMLSDAEAAQTEVDATLAELAKTREGIAAERNAVLAEAREKAATDAKAALTETATKAEVVLKTAQAERERATETMRAKSAAEAAELAVDIARKLLAQFDAGAFQATFLERLVEAIGQMPADDRRALVATAASIDLVSAVTLDNDASMQVTKAVGTALGEEARLNFVTDTDLIAGFELRTPHFTLRDSWQSDLAAIRRELDHAA